MKKVVWWLVVPILCIGGCLKIETHEEEGFIQISGGYVGTHDAIRQLIADRGWQSEREGVQTSGENRRESSGSWVVARTNNGKSVRFDVESGTDKPTIVRIHVEDGASVSTGQVTADLSSRLQQKAHRNGPRQPLTARIDSLARSATEPNAWSGKWTATGDWTDPGASLNFEIRQDGGVQHHSLFVDGAAPWKASDQDGNEGTVNFQLKQPAGTLDFEGHRSSGGGSGTVTFRPDMTYVREMAKLVSDPLDGDRAITLLFHNIDVNYAQQMKEALGDGLTLDGLVTLSSFHVSPDYAKGVRQAGYKFSANEIVRLTSFRIGLEMLRGFKQAGYDFSVDELIRINSFHLKVDDFTAFRNAGCNFSIDEMIRASSFHIPVETARSLHEAGFRYNLDQLIRLNSFHIAPDYIITFKQAGYDLSLDEVIRAQSFHINADNAASLKRMGYNFSLEDLIRLQSFHVPMEFMRQVHNPQYENFTADELIQFQQRRLSADDINKIRTSKRTAQP